MDLLDRLSGESSGLGELVIVRSDRGLYCDGCSVAELGVVNCSAWNVVMSVWV
jgi:hypothetical protein